MNSLRGFIYIFVGFFISINSFFSQDSIIFLNGKTYEGIYNSEDHRNVYFEKKKKEDQIKLISFNKEQIFYLHNEEQRIKMIYRKNFLKGNYFSEKEMGLYIKGEQDAIKNFNIGYHFLLGCALGLTGGLIDTYEFKDPNCRDYFNSSASVISILTPFALSVAIGFPNKKVRRLYVSDERYLNSDHYKLGFNQVKLFRKTFYSFLGSLTGVASILTITFIHQKNHSCP